MSMVNAVPPQQQGAVKVEQPAEGGGFQQQNNMSQEEFYIRVRGLPFSATAEDIFKFFSDVDLLGGTAAITFTFTKDGRASGEAYVAVCTKQDQEKALQHNREHMSNRYVEVFESNRDEMEYVVRKSGANPNSANEAVLRLRGLPFGCSKEEVAQFFSGYEIVPNGITLTTDMQGRTAGDAYVQFTTQEVAEKACSEKNMQRIGHRYIELFRSTAQEARSAGAGSGNRRPMRPAPYDRHDRYSGGSGGYGGGPDRYGGPPGGYGGRGGRYMKSYHDDYDDGYGGYGDRGRTGAPRGRRGGSGGGASMGGGMRGGGGSGNSVPGANHRSSTGHSVHMRGIPFSADELDVRKFFSPISPVEIHIGYNDDGRKSGEADVDFMTHEEACEAMKRDKSHMEHRYIELFLNSKSGMGRSGPSQGGSGGYRNSGPPMGRMSGGMNGGGGAVSHSMDPRSGGGNQIPNKVPQLMANQISNPMAGNHPPRGMGGSGDIFPANNYGNRTAPNQGNSYNTSGFSSQQMPGGNSGFQSFG